MPPFVCLRAYSVLVWRHNANQAATNGSALLLGVPRRPAIPVDFRAAGAIIVARMIVFRAAGA
ncbi:MAG: hypothetical protein FWD31_06495, partial [Planctomycetaceae bacterium]|nr:hypothetical protein [Planctomycetaceae bacterium]